MLLLNNSRVCQPRMIAILIFNRSINIAETDSQTNKILCNDVRVRFAPSPTGFMHIGGLRTAFINYLYAKQNNGKFIIRLEDTDRQRYKPDTVDDIFKSLEWAGMIADESPQNGGPYGSYVQSERGHLYREAVAELLRRGAAYHCFCSPHRLELLRREQARRNEQLLGYDGKCRSLSQQEVEQRLNNKEEHVVRFKLDNEITTFKDLICGEKEYIVTNSECDPIILKRDGNPVYHLANVVDDHHMQISHVIRGIEWLPSTPKHILLYRAFGWKPPQFAHLPLLLNEKMQKLSKRDASSTSSVLVRDFIADGQFAPAVLSWLLSAGGGLTQKTWNAYMTMQNMLQDFSLDYIPCHNVHISRETLHHCGLAYVNHTLLTMKTEGNTDEFDNIVTQANQYLYSQGFTQRNLFKHQHLVKLSSRISKLSNIMEYSFMWNQSDFAETLPLAAATIPGGLRVGRELLIRFTKILQSTKHCHVVKQDNNSQENPAELSEEEEEDNDTTSCHSHLKQDLLQIHDGLCSRIEAMKFLRIFLTGREQGLPIVELVELIGEENVLSHIQSWLHAVYD